MSKATDLKAYAKYLIEDQMRSLLSMRYSDIAEALGFSRPTLNQRMKDYGTFQIHEIEKAESYIKFVKAAILTTEATTGDSDDKIRQAALDAIEATNLCPKHMEYHGQQSEDCTPEKRVMIEVKSTNNQSNELREIGE